MAVNGFQTIITILFPIIILFALAGVALYQVSEDLKYNRHVKQAMRLANDEEDLGRQGNLSG